MNHMISIFDGSRPGYTVNLDDFRKNMVTMGRSTDNDIVLESPIVSRHHAIFLYDGVHWIVQDNHSVNGMFVNGKRREAIPLDKSVAININNLDNELKQGVILLYGDLGAQSQWKQFELMGQKRVTIGRDTSCDIVLEHISVSKVHAVITQEKDGYYIADNNSTNGLAVNGRRISGKKKLSEKDIIVITNSKLIFSNHAIQYVCSRSSGISVEAIDIVKTVSVKKKKMNICNHVSLTIQPGELVAIIGGSGAGKTTFMNCISGYNRATSGQILVNGENFYDNYETMKSIIGYVPQQDIVYDNLRLFDMLEYVAELRMSKDSTKEDRQQRVWEVLKQMDLLGREDNYIRSLSGGQKKRASIAVELISDPNLFFLDEPTSGLDPGTERSLMQQLKQMSQVGKTIILVTHNTMNLHLCDKIIFMGKGGNLCYYGSPNGALQFFGVDNFVDIYNLVTENSEEWKARFLQSELARRHENVRPQVSHQIRAKKKESLFSQLSVLSRRYMELIVNDRARLLLLLIQAPLLAVLINIVANGKQFVEYEMTKSILFALACSSFWIGILNAIQEICKERVILKREYMSGLRMSAYLLSKFLVLGFMCVVQAILLTGVFVLLVGSPEYGKMMNAFLELTITTFLTMMSATAMGLFVSSIFHNPDRAMTVAPILLMPQILFSGLVFSMEGFAEKISYIVNCRWTMEGYGTTANLNGLILRLQNEYPIFHVEHEAENFFTYTNTHLLLVWCILILMVLAFGIAAEIILKKNAEKE